MLNTMMKAMRRMPYRLLLICFTLAVSAATAAAGTATLAWNAPATNTDGSPVTGLAGYNVYYGTASATYGTPINAGPATTCQVTGLADGVTYFFAVTAYNTAGIESSFSGEVTKTMPPAVQTFTLSATAGANGVISPAGNLSLTSGAGQTYTITPAAGYHVSSVLVDGVSAGAVTSYPFTNVTANHTISATFAIDAFTITASVSGNATISPSGVVSVASGTSQTFTIKPYTGYTVSSVAVDGVSVGAVTTYTFTKVTANHTIAAAIKARSYSITPSAGAGGTISPAAVVWVPYGGSKTFTITPNTGYHIANVVVDGVSKGAVAAYTFTNLSAKAHTISATFTINTYTITPTAGANGSLSPAGAATVASGASLIVAITPAPGYHVSDVLVDGVSAGPVASYTFANVTADHTIAAFFLTDTFTINAGVSGSGGSISPTDLLTVPFGGNGVFTLIPDAGHHVADVLVDNTSVGPVTSYTFSNIKADHSISASFAVNTYTIMTTARDAGAIAPAGPVTSAYGGNALFSITADAGNVITDVLVDGASVGRVSSFTFTNITANHTIEAVIAANLSCPDPGIPCVERVDGQPDGNNLVNGSPKVDVEFEFRAVVADYRGAPRSVRLALARKADPAPADFTQYDMTCTGDFSIGALCTYRTELPPALQQKFFIEAVLTDGSIAASSPNGGITGPRIELLTDATFTIALRQGWNSITSPYQENLDLSGVLVRKGATAPVPWLTATENAWLSNALYDLSGSDAGRTSLADHAGTLPDAVLIPWRTYWVYLNNADDAYALILTKPLPNATGP